MESKDLFEDNVNVGGSSSNSQFLKTYEETKTWLDKMGVRRYKINKDTLTVDVDGNVNLINKNMVVIPVKFDKVSGWFNVEINKKLKSLIGCPDSSSEIYCHSTRIKNFNGLGSIKTVVAYGLQSLESFEGLPNDLESLNIENSCYKVNSLEHFPKIITDRLSITPDFKLVNSLHEHMVSCGAIILSGDIKYYNSILKLLYVNNIKEISLVRHNGNIASDILNTEIKRQPDPRKRNLLKVAQELSNAGFHHLTV